MKFILGIILVSVSLVIFVATFYPLAKNEVTYRINQNNNKKIEEIAPLSTDFGIVIPKLGINSRVVKNVDPNNAYIYQKALSQGVAHAKGTALPNEPGNVFIFSHSSENFYEAVRYNSIFYLLTKLEIGDALSLYYENKRFDYHVSEKKIVNPEETKYLNKKSDQSQLTLMTCYPPGTNLKRLIVVAK